MGQRAVAKFYYKWKKFVWEVTPVDMIERKRIFVDWSSISAIAIDDGNLVITIEVNRVPTFSKETNVESKKSKWTAIEDFTHGQATTWRHHFIDFVGKAEGFDKFRGLLLSHAKLLELSRVRLTGDRFFPAAPAVPAGGVKEAINIGSVPIVLAPSSQAIKANNFLFVAGVLGVLPESMNFVSSDVESQTQQALKNLGEILTAGGCDYSAVVQTTVRLANIEDIDKMNEIYTRYFSTAYPPVRSVCQAALPLNAKVQIDSIAAL